MESLTKETQDVLKHLALSIAHNGVVPPDGFGGCSCEWCSYLREEIRSVWSTEAEEFLRAHQ